MTAATNYAVNGDIDAGDTFVEFQVGKGQHVVSVSIGGTFVATVTVQRKRPDQIDTDYKDLFSTTEASEKIIDIIGPMIIRAGVKTGEYTSGSCEIDISGV